MTSAPKWLVLVVEDEADVRALIVRALVATEHEVIAVENAAQALAQLEKRPLPNLVISDVMMPGMDGIQMAKLMKSTPATSHVPVIFLTARGMPKDMIAGIQAGARHYVTKPFRIPDLLEKVRKVLPVQATAAAPTKAKPPATSARPASLKPPPVPPPPPRKKPVPPR